MSLHLTMTVFTIGTAYKDAICTLISIDGLFSCTFVVSSTCIALLPIVEHIASVCFLSFLCALKKEIHLTL